MIFYIDGVATKGIIWLDITACQFLWCAWRLIPELKSLLVKFKLEFIILWLLWEEHLNLECAFLAYTPILIIYGVSCIEMDFMFI